MKEKNELVKNTAILAVGKISTQMLSFLLLPLYTFFLSPSDFGRIDLVLSYVSLLSPVLVMQLDRAVFRYLIDVRSNKAEQSRVVSSAAALVLPVAVLSVLMFGGVAYYLQSAILLAAAVAAIVMILSNQLFQVSRGLGNNKLFSIASIVTGVIMFATTVLLVAVVGVGAIGILIAMILAHVIAVVYMSSRLGIFGLLKRGSIDRSLQKDMLKYSLPLVPSGVSWWAIGAADRTIISIVLGVAANGIYAIANRYATILSIVYGIFDMSWTESASVYINSSRRHKFFSDVANSSLRMFGSLGLLLVSGMGLVFPLLVHEEFMDAYKYFPYMVIAALLNSTIGIYSAIYIAKKMTKRVLNTSIAAAAISIVLTVVLIPFIQLYAAILSTIVAYGFMSVFRHIDTKKYVKITYKKRVFVELAIAYVLVYWLYFMQNILAGVASVLVAVVATYLFNRSTIHVLFAKVLSRLGMKSHLTKKQAVSAEELEK
jgi:O-antigen/teichoic acid export membrane protein